MHVGDGTHSAKCPLIHVQFGDKPQVGDSRVASSLHFNPSQFPHITIHLSKKLCVHAILHLSVNDRREDGLSIEQWRVVGEGGVGDVEVNGENRDLLRRKGRKIR